MAREALRKAKTADELRAERRQWCFPWELGLSIVQAAIAI